jgi:hypothetical protein
MALLPAIVAQVLSAGIGDRIEARAVFEQDDRRIEAENGAYAAVALTYPWLTLRLAYSPSVTLAPIESSPRVLSLTHTVDGTADSNLTVYQRARFSVGVHLGLSYRQEDFRDQLYGSSTPSNVGAKPPATPPGTPPSDASAADAVRADSPTTRYGTATAGVSFTENLSRRSTLTESAGYSASIGLDGYSRTLYPFAHGPSGAISYLYAWSPRDTLTTNLNGEVTFSPSTDGRAYRFDFDQRWLHLFSRQTTGFMSLGVSYTRSESRDVSREAEIYPTVAAGISYSTRAAGGELSLGMGVSYSPVLDRTRLIFDPRIGVSGGVGWTKRRWRLYAATETTVSVSRDNPGSLSAASGRAGVEYDIGSGFAADAGVRGVWEFYEGSETIAPTWEAFIGLSWGYDLL